VVDYHVDRPEVEASQGVELTGTNRSEILTNTLVVALKVLLCTAFKTSRRDRLELRLAIAAGSKFLAPMAAGSHPFPSRTRQLSSPAPMIVGPQGPSKVGRCQIL
jgi:hypothetical protein